MKIRITKEFTFETAHALDGYLGKCSDIHGHSYQLNVTILGSPKRDVAESDCGMVIDFKVLKQVMHENVLHLFDHRLILKSDSRFKGIENMNPAVRYVNYQPTCENMIIEIVSILAQKLPARVSLICVALKETSTSSAEWHAEDNL